MAEDLNFNFILDELKSIHEKHLDLSFGQAVQIAVDQGRMKKNVDLTNCNSKQILTYLRKYNDYTKENRELIKAKKQRLIKLHKRQDEIKKKDKRIEGKKIKHASI